MFLRIVTPVLLLILAIVIGLPSAHAQIDPMTAYNQTMMEQNTPEGISSDLAAEARLGAPPAMEPKADVPEVKPDQPPQFDYSANLNSDVFGANLFTGAFARETSALFNPEYVVNVGDSVRIRMWGAYQYQSTLTVDPQGNIFLPNVGPVQLLGVRNKELQQRVESAIKQVFRSNVFVYASLTEAQPVRIYVGGFVQRPGAYVGTSMDTILHYLDQAGGIDPERGSFLDVQVKRGAAVRARINLYDFLLNGEIPQVQLTDGDVIFVGPRTNTVKVSGLAENAKRFEFATSQITLARLADLAKPRPEVTHVRVVRNTGTTRNIDYYAMDESSNVEIRDGDEVAFTADKKPGTITVRVEGEHESPQEYVLPYGSRMGELLSRIEYSERSDQGDVQLFRESVKQRQKQLLEASLRALETAALTARSGTEEEARLRKEEADLILKWVDRAKKVEPRGQVVISQSPNRDDLLLENGDILRVPAKDGLILVSGEVLFPNAVAFDRSLDVGDYVARAGGFTNNADSSRIVVARKDGSFAAAKPSSTTLKFGNRRSALSEGDEILVLPKIDVKSRQIFKEMTQIIYQIAVSARVALGL